MLREVRVPLAATEFQRRLIANLLERGWACETGERYVLSKVFDSALEADAEYSKALIESVRP